MIDERAAVAQAPMETGRSDRFDIERFTLAEMLRCGAVLRVAGEGTTCVEHAAGRVVRLLHDSLMTTRGERASVLTRLYKTHPFALLPPSLAERARAGSTQPLDPNTPCLTLLATAGVEPAWNDRRSSKDHQAIPLPSEEVVARSPMIAHLLKQMGLTLGALLGSSPLLDAHERVFNVFHVPDARGSELIPVQAFVERYGVRSVLGFGGVLAGADVFAVIVFSRAPIARETASLFQTVALNVKLALLGRQSVFADAAAA